VEPLKSFALPVPVTATPRPLYLQVEPDPIFTVLHTPAAESRRATGVVLCPPFGYEALCAHRSYLRWAEALADAGHAALRIDLPSTGESAGSPRDPQRLQAWSAAVAGAAGWMAQTGGCERVVALGIGLGGMLAWHAAAHGALIDDLILWSVPARGTVLVRELNAFAQIVAGSAPEGSGPEASEPADGSLEVGGNVLTAETLAALKELDLSTLALPEAPSRRVLLLGRDTLPVDRHVVAALEGAGADVMVAPGVGFGAMMNSPEAAQAPHAVFAQTIAWLADEPREPTRPHRPPHATSTPAPLDINYLELPVRAPIGRETPIEIEFHGQQLRGVLIEPTATAPAAICAVLLNDGASRRIGPNRMWVEASRRWVSLGVPTLRLDVLGIGESDGDETRYRSLDELYRDDLTDQVLTALSALADRGVAERFFLAGLCSGAYWSFHAARADNRVRAIALINLWSFFWTNELTRGEVADHALQLLREGNLSEFRRLAFGPGTARRIFNAAGHYVGRVLGSRRAAVTEVDQAFAQLHERDVRTLLLLSSQEQLERDMIAAGRLDDAERWAGVALERIPTAQHHFGAQAAQRFVHAALDEALTLALEDGLHDHSAA
jgi:pimeloyl-ACP methyl ester carboxylesterase